MYFKNIIAYIWTLKAETNDVMYSYDSGIIFFL